MTQAEMARQLALHQRELYAIAWRMMRSEQDALDQLSETAYRACLKAGSLKDEARVRPWLCAIMANCCRMALRRRRPSVDADQIQLAGPDQTGDIDARAMLERLPKSDREIMLLRYFADLGPTDIARALGLPESTVRHRIKRSLSALRLQLEED